MTIAVISLTFDNQESSSSSIEPSSMFSSSCSFIGSNFLISTSGSIEGTISSSLSALLHIGHSFATVSRRLNSLVMPGEWQCGQVVYSSRNMCLISQGALLLSTSHTERNAGSTMMTLCFVFTHKSSTERTGSNNLRLVFFFHWILR